MLNVPDTEIKEGQFNLLLDNFEGPIDLLLVLARSQKVDLSDISISELPDQYINFINQYRNIHIEIAADYLVMAAWLTYLKSRLLLPKEEKTDDYTADELEEALKYQLQRLEAFQNISKIIGVFLNYFHWFEFLNSSSFRNFVFLTIIFKMTNVSYISNIPYIITYMF